MKIKIIIALVVLVPLLAYAKPLETQVLEIIPNELSIAGQIEYYSNLYGADSKIVSKVIQCESEFNPNAHNPNGEDSWGLVQINLDSHPEITKEQALDTNFSINYLVENISNGRGKMWSSWRAIINGGKYTFYSSKLHKKITINCKL